MPYRYFADEMTKIALSISKPAGVAPVSIGQRAVGANTGTGATLPPKIPQVPQAPGMPSMGRALTKATQPNKGRMTVPKISSGGTNNGSLVA